jgi:hypothetical protein
MHFLYEALQSETWRWFFFCKKVNRKMAERKMQLICRVNLLQLGGDYLRGQGWIKIFQLFFSHHFLNNLILIRISKNFSFKFFIQISSFFSPNSTKPRTEYRNNGTLMLNIPSRNYDIMYQRQQNVVRCKSALSTFLTRESNSKVKRGVSSWKWKRKVSMKI